MKYTEETTLFACAGDTLLGILAKPETPGDIGVIVIVGGPQYRAGSHRQFVLLSRALATAGYPVIRFDYRGMGDSEGQQRDFQAVSADIKAAIDVLHEHMPSVRQVALWGLCDGASAALLYCHETRDPRVSGLCLLNPWVRSEASLARTQVRHYYTRRVLQKEFWLKLLNGKVARGALSGLAQKIRLSVSGSVRSEKEKLLFQQRMATAWNRFSGQILLLLSGEDYVAKEFLEYAGADSAWKGTLERPNLLRKDLSGVDHTFSNAASRELVENLTLDWLAGKTAPTQPTLNRAVVVSVFSHPDELPPDVLRLFETAERESIEFGIAWYRNLVNSVYPDHEGVRIYVLHHNGLPVAALPVLVTKSTLSQRVESLSNYYTAIYSPVVAQNVTSRDLVPLIAAIREGHRSLTSMKFSPMDSQSANYRMLLDALKMAGMLPFEYFCFGNWFLQVDGEWSSYLKSRSGLQRSTIKRMGKKFSTDGGTLELLQGGVDLERSIDAYERVYAASWKVAEPHANFIPGLIRACAERGWLRLGVAWLKDEPIAAQLWFVAGGKAYIYKLAYHEAYKTYAPGTLLTAMLMEHAIEEDRAVEVDYLIGDDPYKKSWMSHRRERWGIIAYNPKTISGIFGLGKEVSGRILKPVVARVRILMAQIGKIGK